VASHKLEGEHPAKLGIREKTGCSVVAVEREDELLVEFGGEFRFERADAVYICGSSETVRKFTDLFARD
jgi:K+/H+ antiporter YhaU regulatory subunit KhtT